jgi:spore coat protein A
MGMMDPATEVPALNSTEMWEIFNATEDAHPIHLHLVHFRTINTQKYEADIDTVTGALSNIVLKGSPSVPSASDDGWVDTQIMFPEEVTRIVATFDRAGKYAWHCHILSHEDHEMMRPFVVTEATAIQGNNLNTSASMLLEQNYPNPFNHTSELRFSLVKDQQVNLSIYNPQGKKVVELINQYLPAGTHTITVEADGLSSGLYYYSLQTGGLSLNKKMEVIN